MPPRKKGLWLDRVSFVSECVFEGVADSDGRTPGRFKGSNQVCSVIRDKAVRTRDFAGKMMFQRRGDVATLGLKCIKGSRIIVERAFIGR